MIFDTHAHYDDAQFDADRDELLMSMKENDVGTIVNVSATYASCEKVIALAKKYPFMYAATGIHPDEVGSLNEETFSQLKIWCQEEKVVAVGEIGLDYYWDKESHEEQKKWFIRQLHLARELNLPVNIHSRDASEDTFQIMKEYGKGLEGIIHCFSGSKELALEYVKLGFHIGVGGVVTFKNGKKLKQVVEAIPLTSIVLETDCPYLAPEPYRGKRNNSSYIRYVAEEIASLKGVTFEEVVRQTEENAKKIYRIQ
ncbi:TatD family hydrolase [Faecalicatena contorta]|uniref:TatD family hydrolase n=1 Tax=Faecalicatena contorta TaxID=39482 RepID=UPI001F430D18|nr:TatD family hydrolase [Faecalicatena contorta]MCF2680645.1 TatD family hydrolase [Faecalicatena contorta]